MIKIKQVETSQQLEKIRDLFQEYVASLGFELHFQDYRKEIAELPGDYTLPGGCLLLAEQGNKIIGCVALRKISDTICEMKRMYIRPKFRGRGFGKKLAYSVIAKARKMGYRRMRLDTIAFMKEAITLYQSLGFIEIPPYRYNPMEGAKFMELVLENTAKERASP